MTRTTGTDDRDLEHALYIDDIELRRRINPKIGMDRFAAKIKAAEPKGFPTIHPVWEGRYWPAVLAYMDRDNGVTNNASIGNGQDGAENFDAAPKRHTRPESRPTAAPLLDRQQNTARHIGIPRALHSIASRR